MIKRIKILYLKDLKESLRDKNILILALMIPITVIFAILLGSFLNHTIKNKKESDSIVIIGDKTLAPKLEEKGWHIKDHNNNWQTELREKKIAVVLEIPEQFDHNIKQYTSPTIKLHYNNIDESKILKKITKHLTEINDHYRTELSQSLQINEQQITPIKTPFTIKPTPVTSIEESTNYFLALFLAFFLLSAVHSGLTLPVLDIGIGEKERGTLETLIISPASLLSIVIAKCGVVVTFAMASVCITLVPLSFVGIFIDKLNLDLFKLFACALVILPYTFVVVPVYFLISLFAKTFKEAQGYITPLVAIGYIGPSFIYDYSKSSVDFYWIPILNTSFSIRDIMNNTFNFMQFLSLNISSFAVSMLLIFACTFVLKKAIKIT